MMSQSWGQREKTVVDTLFKFLRDEITQCIYLEHAALLALIAFLGVIAISVGRIIESIGILIKYIPWGLVGIATVLSLQMLSSRPVYTGN